MDDIKTHGTLLSISELGMTESPYSEQLATLLNKAFELDNESISKLHPDYSTVSRSIAELILTQDISIQALSDKYENLFRQYTADHSQVPFALLQAVKFAINRKKIAEIDNPNLFVIGITYFKEAHRAEAPSEFYPHGEDAPVQKVKDMLFLIKSSNTVVDMVYMNDAIAEKKEDLDTISNTPLIYRRKIISFALENPGLAEGIELRGSNGEKIEPSQKIFDEEALLAQVSEIILAGGRLRIVFTSLEEFISEHETAESPSFRNRFERRSAEGKLIERKGGGVLASFERPIDNYREDYRPEDTMRVMVDADRAFPEAGFLGDMAYSILVEKNIAYLGDLRDPLTLKAGADMKSPENVIDQTKAKRRKLFLSGLLVPTFFRELKDAHNYTGTTQLPIKAASGTVDFTKYQLQTIQPNIDLGIISVLLDSANKEGKLIGSGPIIAIDNLESSTMSSQDLAAEWEKTYGPIFKSVEELVRSSELKNRFGWLLDFVKRMDLRIYTKLFTDINDPIVGNIFRLIETAGETGYTETIYEELEQAIGSLR